MNNSFIYGEVLNGVVDGVNKSFTSLQPIANVESLRVGGAEYSAFSFVGNVITLDDAPTVELGAPEMDYFYESPEVVTTMSGTTLGALVDSIYLRIGQDSTSYQFPIELVKEYVIEAITTIANKRVNPIRNTGTFTFNKSADAITVGYSPTEVNLGTVPQYVPSQGVALIDSMGYFNYGGKSSSSLTSITNLGFVYESSNRVKFGYLLPENVKKVSEVVMDGVVLTFRDFREYTFSSLNTEYTIKDRYLILPFSSESAVVNVSYVKQTVIPTNDGDDIDFEPEYMKVFKLYVLKEIYADREEDRYVLADRRYREALVEYKSYISRQVEGTNNTIPSSVFEGL